MFDKIGEDKRTTLNNFSDTRLKRRYDKVKKQLESGHSSVMNKISSSRAERKGSYEFFRNPRVKEEQIKSSIYESIDQQVIKGSNLLVIQDTTEYNFARSKGRLKDMEGLGDIGNKYGFGYFAHPSIVMNNADNSLLGISDLQLWNRATDRPSSDSRKQREFEEKESYKWHVGLSNSHKRLSGAEQVTYVQDRDGDIYESIVKVKGLEGAELLVRNRCDRRIKLGQGGETTMLYSHLEEQAVLFSYELRIKGDKRIPRSSRIAQLEVRSVRVEIVRPVNLKKTTSPSVEVDVVWIREKDSSVPPGESPIDWKLITTHPVNGDEFLIKRLIGWYVSRWKIEEFFLSQKQVDTI